MKIIPSKDYYKLLGIDKSATKEEIKRAFRKMARKYHPDVNPDQPKSGEKFKEVNEAYNILNDDKKREMYDKFGVVEGDPSSYYQQDPGGGGTHSQRAPDGSYVYTSSGNPGDFSDFFKNMRGSGAGGHGGSDFFNDLGDIFEVFSGSGNRSTRPSGRPKIPREGDDLRYDMEISFMDAFYGDTRKVQYTDPATRKSSTITIKIPRGVHDNQKLRLKGKGMPGENGGADGDLYISIHVKDHPTLKRNDDDLYIEQEIPYTTAVLGGKAQIPSVEGGTLSVTILPGTQDLTTLRLKNQGFYFLNSEKRGALLVKIKIRIPNNLNEQQEDLLMKLKDSGL